MTPPDLELRILAGVHRGATVALDASVAAFSLGSDVQNDVILTDAPFKSVQLSVNAMGFLWDAQGACAQVQVDQGVRAGSLALSLSSAASPWSDEPPAGWAVDQPSDPLQPSVAKPVGDQDVSPPAKASPLPQTSSLRPGDPQASAAQSSADPDADRELSHGEKAVTAGSARRRRVGWLWGVALGGTLAMGVALVAWVVLGIQGQAQDLSPPVSAAAAPPEVNRVDPALLTQVRQVVERMAASGTVQVRPFAGGKIQLLGVTESDEKTEALLRAAAAITPAIKLSIITQAEFASRAKTLAASLPDGVELVPQPVGRLVVTGTVEDEAKRDQLQALLLEEVAAASHLSMNVLTAKEKAAREARELVARTPKAPSISAVVSGLRPYVILPGGQKVQPGGLVQDLRLSSIESDFVVFEDRAGVRFKMPR